LNLFFQSNVLENVHLNFHEQSLDKLELYHKLKTAAEQSFYLMKQRMKDTVESVTPDWSGTKI
jgi:hypothetical protein